MEENQRNINEKKEGLLGTLDWLSDTIFLWFKKILDHYGLLILAIFLSLCALGVRYAVFRYPSHDIYAFIFNWIKNFRANGNLAYLKEMQGDYPPLYMTVLALISYLPSGPEVTTQRYNYFLYDMFYVKTLSFIFDFVLAFGVYKLVRLKNKDNHLLCFISYIVPLFLPTVLVNSAFWGQCDVIYVAFVVWSVYFILKDDTFVSRMLSSAFIGLALANKLQTIFIIPLFGYLWLKRKYKLRYLVFTISTVFVTFIPAYILGASFVAPFQKYINLTQEYMNPNYNSGSIYSFIQDIAYRINDSGEPSNQYANYVYNLIHYGGMIFALAISFFFLIILYKKDIQPTVEKMVGVGAFYAILLPFTLPHMHERYFFMADIMVLVYCLVNKKKYWLIFVAQLASMITLMPYIFNSYIISSWGHHTLRIAALLNLFMLYVIFKDIISPGNKAQSASLEKIEN